jgi:hypothetical protein
MKRSHPAVAARARLADLRRTDAELRQQVLAVRQWALANGVPVDPDALAVVVGTLLDDERAHGVARTQWTEARVVEFMWTACLLWCLEHGIGPPPGVADGLRAYWAHLASLGAFSPDSEPLSRLVAALTACSGPARPRQRPSGRSGRDAG